MPTQSTRHTADTINDDALEALYAERDQLLAELAGRSEEARERWIQQQLAETGLRAADFRNGMTMEIEPARELVAHWVGAARAMLGDAPNYSETPIEMHVKVGESPERFAFVLQRVAPDALTPHQARQEAERQRDAVLRIVAAWCTEANEHGGLDAGDLAWRLETAGYPLPDEGEAPTGTVADRTAQVEAERDGVYRERAQLLAWLATLVPAVITPATDVDEPGWLLLYLHTAAGQLSWHIAPRDVELFAHVEHVPADDPRAQWDGHTTDEKYERIRGLVARYDSPGEQWQRKQLARVLARFSGEQAPRG